MSATPAPFLVLVVCTGNVCRSPLAEQMLRAGFDRFSTVAGASWRHGQGMHIASRGTAALAGEAMTEQTSALLRAAGIAPTPHVARQLSARAVEAAGLVLGVTREHRRAIVSAIPSASRKTFALTEFSRLLGSLEEDGLVDWAAGARPDQVMPSLVHATALRRGFVPPLLRPDDDDVIDPYGHTDDVYAASGRQIGDATDALFDHLHRLARVGTRL